MFNSPALTCPTGATDQQRRTLCPPGHCVISEVTRCENRFLDILLLLLGSRGGKAGQSEQNVCFTVKPEKLVLSKQAGKRDDGRPAALELRKCAGQPQEELVLHLQWGLSERGGWSVIQSCCPANDNQQ